MVSFFGLKFGGKKKHIKHVSGRPDLIDELDQPYDGYGPNSGSRPGTAHSMIAPPRGLYTNPGAASSLQDLGQHSRNAPSFSSLRPGESDPPRAIVDDPLRPRSESLPKLSPEHGSRPGTAGGLRKKSLGHSPLEISAMPPPQGPPPSSSLPAPPTSPLMPMPAAPLSAYASQFQQPNRADGQNSSFMTERPTSSEDRDGKDEIQGYEQPLRKDSLASQLGSRPESPLVQGSQYPAEAVNVNNPHQQNKSAGTRGSDTSSFYSLPSTTRSSMAPGRENKEQRSSSQHGTRPSHQYNLSLSTQNEDENEDKDRRMRWTKYPSPNDHPEIDFSSSASSPIQSTTPNVNPATGNNFMRLPSLHLDKTSLIPSPLRSPASSSEISPPLPSPGHNQDASLRYPPQHVEDQQRHRNEYGQENEAHNQYDNAQPGQRRQFGSQGYLHGEQDQDPQTVSLRPLSPQIRMHPASLAPISTNVEQRSASAPPQRLNAAGGAEDDDDDDYDYESDKHSENELCHSPTWEGFWGPKKTAKKQEKQRKKDEKKKLKEQRKAAKSGKKIISAPVPISVPESAAAAPPLPSPLLPGYSGEIQVTQSPRPDSPAVLAMSSGASRTMSPAMGRVDSPMMASRAMSSATTNTMLTALRVDSPATTRAVSPAGTFNSSLRSPGFPPGMSSPLGSAASRDGRFPSMLGSGPIPAPGTPDLESPRKAPIPPSPATSPRLGSDRLQDARFPNIAREGASNPHDLESPRKAPSPPTSPRSISPTSTTQFGTRFDARSPPNPATITGNGVSTRERESSNEPDSPRFSTIASSQFAPAPLSPSPRTIGLAPPPRPHGDVGGNGTANPNGDNRDLSGLQTPLQQDGFGRQDHQSPGSASHTGPSTAERRRFDAHPPHLSPAFGGGPGKHGHGRFSLEDDKSVDDRSKAMLSRVDETPTNNGKDQQMDASHDKYAQGANPFGRSYGLKDETRQLRVHDVPDDTVVPVQAQADRIDEHAPSSNTNMDQPVLGGQELAHSEYAPRGSNERSNGGEYRGEEYKSGPMRSIPEGDDYQPEPAFNGTYDNGYAPQGQGQGEGPIDSRNFGHQPPGPPGHIYGEQDSHYGPHPDSYQQGPEPGFNDYDYQGRPYDDRGYDDRGRYDDRGGYNDGYFDGGGYGEGYVDNGNGPEYSDQHNPEMGPFNNGHPQQYPPGNFDRDYDQYQPHGPPRDYGDPSINNTFTPPPPAPVLAPKQRTYKPFVPGAQVPDDQDVSDLVAMPLNPSLRVEVPIANQGAGGERHMPPSAHARDRNGSITYGAGWAASQMQPPVQKEGFGISSVSSGAGRGATPTPPPSHATSSSPASEEAGRQSFAMEVSSGAKVHDAAAPPTPSETPVNDHRNQLEDSTVQGSDDDTQRKDYEPPSLESISFGSEPTETPTVRTFGAPPIDATTPGSPMVEGSSIREATWGAQFEPQRTSYVSSSLHSSFINNYVHSWNGDLDQQYRERYPQFFSETGQPLFHGIADGGDGSPNNHLTKPNGSPTTSNISSNSSNLEAQPGVVPHPNISNPNSSANSSGSKSPNTLTVPDQNTDPNWPLPSSATSAPTREKKRPPPLKFDEDAGPTDNTSWMKLSGDGPQTAPLGGRGSGLEIPVGPRTPLTARDGRGKHRV